MCTIGSAPFIVKDSRVRGVLNTVELRLGSFHLTLRSLALAVKLSDRYLGALFTREVGQSFHTFLRSKRMLLAGELLIESRLSIKEIATQTGYTATPNFNRDFTRFHKLTPKAFRLLYGQGG